MPPTTPIVSVVIPAYNAERFLAETIDSVISQTFREWELIIVDDGSKDNTGVIAGRYAACDPRIRVVRQENRGLAAARNRGYDEASAASQFFLFLDADDILKPHALEWLLAGYERDKEAKIVFGFCSFIDDRGLPVHPGFVPLPLNQRFGYRVDRIAKVSWNEPTSFEILVVQNCIQTPGAVLIPRSSLREVGLFEARPCGVEDWDLWLRMSLAGKIGTINEIVLDYRVHTTSMSTQRAYMVQGAITLKKKLLSSMVMSAENRALAKAVLLEPYRCDINYLDRLIKVRAMLGVSAAKRIQPENRLPDDVSDILSDELLLALALDGNVETADKILSNSRIESGGAEITPDDRKRIKRATMFLDAEEIRVRRAHIRGLTVDGKLGSAGRNMYHVVLCYFRKWKATVFDGNV